MDKLKFEFVEGSKCPVNINSVSELELVYILRSILPYY